MVTGRRLQVLVGSVIVSLGSGTNYAYSAYAPQLGDALHISHTLVNVVGLAGNMGVYFTSPLVGRLVDLRGPRILLISAFFLLLTGYYGIKYYFDQAVTPSTIEFLLLCLASFATGVGGNAGFTAAMNTTAKSFPDRMRATTTSIVASGFGLSAFFFSTLAHTMFPGKTSGFLLVLSIGTSIPMLIGLATVRVVQHPEGITIQSHTQPRHSIEVVPERDERRHSQTWEVYTPVVGLGGYERLEQSEIDDELLEASVSQPFLSRGASSTEQLVRGGSAEPDVELSPGRRVHAHTPDIQERVRHSRSRSHSGARPHEHPDVHGWALLRNSNFWVLFCIMCCLSGTGLMYINNVGLMAQALFARGDPKFDTVESAQWQAAQVSITSIANCLGRVIFGSSADVGKNRYGLRRSYFISGISFTFIVSQIALYNVESVQTLWIASALLGLGYGGMFGLFPTIMIEFFGLGHFSQNWGFLCLSPIIASNLFNLAFGRNLDAHSKPIEDVHVRRGGMPDATHLCLEGRLCYVDSVKMTLVACVVALGLSIYGALQDRKRGEVEVASREVVWAGEGEEDG